MARATGFHVGTVLKLTASVNTGFVCTWQVTQLRVSCGYNTVLKFDSEAPCPTIQYPCPSVGVVLGSSLSGCSAGYYRCEFVNHHLHVEGVATVGSVVPGLWHIHTVTESPRGAPCALNEVWRYRSAVSMISRLKIPWSHLSTAGSVGGIVRLHEIANLESDSMGQRRVVDDVGSL